MKTVLAAAVAAAAIVSPVLAAEETQAKNERVVYVCDASEITQRSFEREFGEQTFVTADEAMQAMHDDRKWSAPRCMTKVEYAKLTEALADSEQTIVMAQSAD
jgi:cytochrome c peroxidase